MNQTCSAYASPDEFADIETAMSKCSNNDQCSSILNTNCDGTKFRLCSDGLMGTDLQSCIHHKQRNKISLNLLRHICLTF